jgi:hypothetical protein
VVVRPGDPQVDQVRRLHDIGLRVQVAIQVKRDTTPGDVRSIMRAYGGMVSTVSIGNEPELNGITACAYNRLYRRSYSLVRREFPGVRVGFGEFSPNRAVDYSAAVMRCPGPRIRADFWGWHPYQWQSDPLAPSGARHNGFYGIGDAGHVRRYLRARSTRKRLSTRTGGTLPIACTEFSYLVSGRYAITPERTAELWPRLVTQARRYCSQLVLHGMGPVHEGSNWGSASLLDRFGRRMPGYVALARALGRTLRPERIDGPREEKISPPPAPPWSHGEGEALEPIVPEKDPAPELEEPPPVVEEPAPVETPPVEAVEAP